MTRRPYRRYRSGVSRAIATSHKIKYFTETTTFTDLVLTNSGIHQQFGVKLGDFGNATNYQQLFDVFTLVKFSVKLIPRMGDSIFGTSPGPIAIMAYNINRDGQVGPPASILEVQQDDRSRTLALDGKRIIKMYVSNPKPYLVQADNTNTAVLVEQPLKKWQWLDTLNGRDTLWYGLTIAIETSSNVPVGTYTPIVTATFGFKEQH